MLKALTKLISHNHNYIFSINGLVIHPETLIFCFFVRALKFRVARPILTASALSKIINMMSRRLTWLCIFTFCILFWAVIFSLI